MEVNNIGQRLSKLRNSKKASQAQVAQLIGISVKTYRSIEQGRTCGRIDTLTLLAEYFKVSLDYLVCGRLNIENEIFFKISELSDENKKKAYRILEAVIEILE
ncbi:MAG: helix-turn-helix domain-containing protein [Clostridium sp.]|nr:helix-turn-helix domain-containing protein [Clostridium sp.]